MRTLVAIPCRIIALCPVAEDEAAIGLLCLLPNQSNHQLRPFAAVTSTEPLLPERRAVHSSGSSRSAVFQAGFCGEGTLRP